jgi:hypothetical protein
MFLTTWKSIRKICDNTDIRTLKKWIKEYGAPIKIIGGKPITTEKAMEKWWEELPARMP